MNSVEGEMTSWIDLFMKAGNGENRANYCWTKLGNNLLKTSIENCNLVF